MAIAEKAAAAAGELLRGRFAREIAIMGSHGKDIKTREDVDAERAAMDILAKEGGGEPILSEESGATGEIQFERGGMWVLDPLDGTLNFAREIPLCCVSVGYWREGKPVAGVIYDFLRHEMFSAAIGVGAWRNGRPVHVSAVGDASAAVIATGFPSGRGYGDASLLPFVRKVQQFKKVRLLGSAALSLAYLSAGLVDVYSEEDIYFWDVAAGLALVGAAGGAFSCSQPDTRWRCRVTAHNGQLPNSEKDL